MTKKKIAIIALVVATIVGAYLWYRRSRRKVALAPAKGKAPAVLKSSNVALYGVLGKPPVKMNPAVIVTGGIPRWDVGPVGPAKDSGGSTRTATGSNVGSTSDWGAAGQNAYDLGSAVADGNVTEAAEEVWSWF